MTVWEQILAFLTALLGLAPKVIDAAKSTELGPPPPKADKDALVHDLEEERRKRYGK